MLDILAEGVKHRVSNLPECLNAASVIRSGLEGIAKKFQLNNLVLWKFFTYNFHCSFIY